MSNPEQLSFGMDPEEAARRKAAVTARLLELALDEMYPHDETDTGSEESDQ
jgi:hypothetical protein